MTHALRWVLALTSLLASTAAIAGGCGSDDNRGDPQATPPSVCKPGEQVECACPGSDRHGVQICNDQGTKLGTCNGCGAGGTSSEGQGGAGSAGEGQSAGGQQGEGGADAGGKPASAGESGASGSSAGAGIGGAGEGGGAGTTAGQGGLSGAGGVPAGGAGSGSGGAAGGAGGGTAAGAAGVGSGGTSTSGGAGGEAGAAGDGTAGAGGENNKIPTTCAEAHFFTGCCGPDGNNYYCEKNAKPDDKPDGAQCLPLLGYCGFSLKYANYVCGIAEASTDPSGQHPRNCGLP
jgi:hypothetical protein